MARLSIHMIHFFVSADMRKSISAEFTPGESLSTILKRLRKKYPQHPFRRSMLLKNDPGMRQLGGKYQPKDGDVIQEFAYL